VSEKDRIRNLMMLDYSQLIMHAFSLEELNDINHKEIERLHTIIKEAKEFIYENAYDTERENCIDDLWGEIPKLLEILDKEVK